MRSQGRKSLTPFWFGGIQKGTRTQKNLRCTPPANVCSAGSFAYVMHLFDDNRIGGKTTFVAGAFKSLGVMFDGRDWQFDLKCVSAFIYFAENGKYCFQICTKINRKFCVRWRNALDI